MAEPKYECPDHPPEAGCHEEGSLCGKWKRISVEATTEKRCERDSDSDGNCDRHPVKRVKSFMEVEDAKLADDIIARLNALLETPSVRVDLARLIGTRIPCGLATLNHPKIQANDGVEGPQVGFLGVLNGIVGTIRSGEHEGWGYISAVCEDDGSVTRFERTKE